MMSGPVAVVADEFTAASVCDGFLALAMVASFQPHLLNTQGLSFCPNNERRHEKALVKEDRKRRDRGFRLGGLFEGFKALFRSPRRSPFWRNERSRRFWLGDNWRSLRVKYGSPSLSHA
jgi:hypothetical protein